MKLVKKVLEYWHLIETLTPNEFPEVIKLNDSEIKKISSFKYIRLGEYLNKFDSEKTNSSFKELEEEFPVLYEKVDYCVGKISKEAVISDFFRKLGKTNPAIENEEGQLCLFGFITIKNDEYLEESFKISPFIWSINKLISNQTIKVNDYKDECTNPEYINILKSSDSIENRIKELFSRLSEKYLSFITDSSAINMDIAKFWSRYKTISDRDNGIDEIQHESSFMSSFILSDLELVIENPERNQLLKNYVEVLNAAHNDKIDIMKDINEIKKILSSKNMPKAKWPGIYPPALMQQIAINYICKGENPLFSVNGPPGTGKTTLLKEIIAQKVYEFALAISKYDNPDDAFSELEFQEKNEVFTKWYKPNDSISKYGILVCSCNNSAVENISLELPELNGLRKNIKERQYEKELFKESDIYFTEAATKLLFKKTKNEDCKAWGLISAPLGKSENVHNVMNSIKGEINQVKNNNIEDFIKAKKEFLEQERIVKSKLKNYSACVTKDYLERLRKCDKKCQFQNPWDIADLDIERERLFIKAIELRKKFLQSSKGVWNNINVLFHLWGNVDTKTQKVKFSERTKYEIFNDLFQTLSMLIPVISTTFASVGTFLKYMKEPEKIGLLIVDEAGQATPQNMVGALYRSKQAVVVGDPLQVEPVVTVPECFNEIISDDKLGKYYSQKESVQTFADRINPIGSYLSSENTDTGKLWVGCPLVVHRRCIEPMFTISNKLSYDCSMINKTEPDSEFEKVAIFDKSYWFDISGTDKEKNHSIEEQAQFVVDSIKNRKVNNEKYKVYVISPFSTVIKRIDSLIKERNIENIECGTVHKFQGKQAEEVFFVLGCSQKTLGAVNWVNANIINVAVTRAKYRLYIVGDRKLWSENRNFEIAKNLLPEGPLKSQIINTPLKKEIQRIVNSLSLEDKYNICITDTIYLLKGTRKCWDTNCNKENPVYAIVANKFIIREEYGSRLNYTDNAFTIFEKITDFDESLKKALNDYKDLCFDTKLKYLANHCSCGKYQKEDYLFSKEKKDATFISEITKERFELIPIKLEQDILLKAKVFKTFVLKD